MWEASEQPHLGGSLSFVGGTPLSLAAGDILIREGEAEDRVYVLVSGILEISRQVDEDTALLARIDQPGAVVGEMVSMGGGIRSATVVAGADSELLSFSSEEFTVFLEDNPGFNEALASAAIRRAEEGELATLLSDHFGIVDDELLVATCGSVDWVRIAQGEVLLREGDASDALFIVVRGRLRATRFDPQSQASIGLGEAGRGDLVGEVGLLSRSPRNATLTALRDSVVARLDEAVFMALVDRQPRLMIDVAVRAVARAGAAIQRTAPSTVLGLLCSKRVTAAILAEGLKQELATFGSVELLSAGRVDSILDSPGLANSAKGQVGEFRVSRLLHELELEADHLVVELGDEPGPWARRSLGMADRLLIAVPVDLTDEEGIELLRVIEAGSSQILRTVVVVHPSGTIHPRDSSRHSARFEADEVIHVVTGSADDLSRLARVVVGRADAFVLGGGGARGFAHIGVLKALEELHFSVDLVGGTSMGAVLGSVMADGWSAEQLIAWAGENLRRALDYTIPIVSLTKGARIEQLVKEVFGDREIEDLWRTYYCLSTNLSSARAHVHRRGSLAAAVRATSAIPGVMPPVPSGEDLLVDGGVLNNIPIDVARDLAPLGRIIAVDVAPTRGPGSHGDYGLSVSGWDALRSRRGSQGRRYPRLAAVLMRSMITASMRERDTQVAAGLADCYLELDMRGVSMLDFEDPAGVARRGYEAAMPSLEAWMSSL